MQRFVTASPAIRPAKKVVHPAEKRLLVVVRLFRARPAPKRAQVLLGYHRLPFIGDLIPDTRRWGGAWRAVRVRIACGPVEHRIGIEIAGHLAKAPSVRLVHPQRGRPAREQFLARPGGRAGAFTAFARFRLLDQPDVGGADPDAASKLGTRDAQRPPPSAKLLAQRFQIKHGSSVCSVPFARKINQSTYSILDFANYRQYDGHEFMAWFPIEL